MILPSKSLVSLIARVLPILPFVNSGRPFADVIASRAAAAANGSANCVFFYLMFAFLKRTHSQRPYFPVFFPFSCDACLVDCVFPARAPSEGNADMYFRPFQLACENMNPKIKATALDCIQKLIGPCPLPLGLPPPLLSAFSQRTATFEAAHGSSRMAGNAI